MPGLANFFKKVNKAAEPKENKQKVSRTVILPSS